MMAWFHALSRRERLLIALMAGLALVLVLMLAVVRPLHGWRADGRLALESAQTTALYVDQAVAVSGQDMPGDAVTGAALRNLITASAERNNIPVGAFQLSQSGDSVVVSVQSVSSGRLYGWLGGLSASNGIVVTEARVSRDRDGSGVQARLTLSQGGA